MKCSCMYYAGDINDLQYHDIIINQSFIEGIGNEGISSHLRDRWRWSDFMSIISSNAICMIILPFIRYESYDLQVLKTSFAGISWFARLNYIMLSVYKHTELY